MKRKILKFTKYRCLMNLTLFLTLLCPIFQNPSVNQEGTFQQTYSEQISCVQMPVEGQLSIFDSVVTVLNTRPIQFGLLVDQDCTIQFSAKKFLRDLDGEMLMKMSLPTGLYFMTGNLTWKGTEREWIIEARVKAEMQGDFLVNATASNLANGFTITLNVAARVRLTSDELGAFEYLNAASPPEEAWRVYTIVDANRSELSSRAPANYAHIHGVAYTYRYSNGRSYMLRGIQLELWEDIPLWPDTHIKTVFTVEPTIDDDYGLTPLNYVSGGVWYHVDDSGKFDFGNVYVGSGKNLYIKLFSTFRDEADGISSSGAEKLRITDAAGNTINKRYNIGYYSSGQDSGILGLTVAQLDAGNSLLEDEAAHIFYDIVKTYGYFESLVAFEPGLVTARIDYSSTSDPFCAGSYIYFAGWTIDYLVYEITDIILHEYSHSVHWYMRGGSFPPLAPGDKNHGGHDNSDSSDALTEGWADFVPTVISKDSLFHWASTTSTFDLRPDYRCPVCGICDRNEWVFASILWDIRGDIFSGSHSGFFSIAYTLYVHDPNLVRIFYDNFISDWGTPLWQVFYNHGVNYDTTPPYGSISINAGATYATSTSVTLALSATDAVSGVAQMRFSNDGSSWTSWEPYATSKSWTLTSGDGIKTAYVQFKDNAGNVATYSDIIILDTTPPTGSITIAGGAAYTTTTAVTLALSASDSNGLAQMRFSNDGSSWSGWYSYANSASWTLASGDGTKTVYVQFKDNVGLESSVFSDTIILDTAPPTGNISINNDAAYTTSTTVTLTLSASDAGSGVSQMHFSNDGSIWSGWESYAASKSWILTSGDGTKTVYVQFKDSAGLISSSYSDTIVLDTTSPSPPTLLSPSDGASVSTRPTFAWNPAIDATSGIASYTLQLDTSSAFNSSKLITVAGIIETSYTPSQLLDEGTWYWRVCATDNAGNVGPYSTPWSINASLLTGLGGDIQIVFSATGPVGFMMTGNIYDDSGIGFMYGHRDPPKILFSVTDTSRVLATGQPTWLDYTHLVIVGGRNANPTTRYYEDNGLAPITFEANATHYRFLKAGVVQCAVLKTSITSSNDYFVVEVVKDGPHTIIILWGVEQYGTYASGVYLDGVWSNLSTLSQGWYVIQWQDLNSNGVQDYPTEFTVAASGN